MLTRPEPLANQLSYELARRISSGELGGEGNRLPSEAELSERYSVSRATIREALAKLELAGIVTRRHGSGTYVNAIVRDRPANISAWLDEAPAFIDLIAQAGHKASSRVLSVAVTPADEVAARLDVPPHTPVVRVEKIFLADDEPIIYSRTAIPQPLVEPGNGAHASPADYERPTYHILAERAQRRVHHQNSEVRAVLADDALAARLNCGVGAPLLQVDEVGYDLNQTPLFSALHHFRGDHVSFRQIRTPSFMIDPPWRPNRPE